MQNHYFHSSRRRYADIPRTRPWWLQTSIGGPLKPLSCRPGTVSSKTYVRHPVFSELYVGGSSLTGGQVVPYIKPRFLHPAYRDVGKLSHSLLLSLENTSSGHFPPTLGLAGKGCDETGHHGRENDAKGLVLLPLLSKVLSGNAPITIICMANRIIMLVLVTGNFVIGTCPSLELLEPECDGDVLHNARSYKYTVDLSLSSEDTCQQRLPEYNRETYEFSWSLLDGSLGCAGFPLSKHKLTLLLGFPPTWHTMLYVFSWTLAKEQLRDERGQYVRDTIPYRLPPFLTQPLFIRDPHTFTMDEMIEILAFLLWVLKYFTCVYSWSSSYTCHVKIGVLANDYARLRGHSSPFQLTPHGPLPHNMGDIHHKAPVIYYSILPHPCKHCLLASWKLGRK